MYASAQHINTISINQKLKYTIYFQAILVYLNPPNGVFLNKAENNGEKNISVFHFKAPYNRKHVGHYYYYYYYTITTTTIVIIFLHGLGRLSCSGIDALPSFPRASTISSSLRFVVEGVFRESGVVHSFKMVDPVLFMFGSHVLYSRDL